MTSSDISLQVQASGNAYLQLQSLQQAVQPHEIKPVPNADSSRTSNNQSDKQSGSPSTVVNFSLQAKLLANQANVAIEQTPGQANNQQAKQSANATLNRQPGKEQSNSSPTAAVHSYQQISTY